MYHDADAREWAQAHTTCSTVALRRGRELVGRDRVRSQIDPLQIDKLEVVM